jgi:hypothetical protein
MTGAEVSKLLSLTKAFSHCLVHSKTFFFVRRLYNGLGIKNDLTSLIDFGVGKLAINLILDLSTSIPFDETMLPSTMSFVTIK